MILAFYSIDSGFDRNSFEDLDNLKKEDAKEILRQLTKDPSECKLFDMSKQDYTSRIAGVEEFCDDFNDYSDFSGGYWAIPLNLDAEEAQKIIEEVESEAFQLWIERGCRL